MDRTRCRQVVDRMKKIREKLHEEDGSSLIIAIVILLICTVLGGIVLSAASANMSRIQRNREEQQAYLTAESVVLTFREQILKENICISLNADGEWEAGIKSEPGTELKEPDDFTKMLCGDIEKVLEGSSVNKENLELSGTKALGNQIVTVTYCMNPGYGVEISVQVASSEQRVLSKLLAEFPAVSQTQDEDTNISWKKGTITRPISVKEEGGAVT